MRFAVFIRYGSFYLSTVGRLFISLALAGSGGHPYGPYNSMALVVTQSGGAQWRPRLARPLNRSLLLTLPTKVYAMRGAALRPILEVLWLTGFDGFCLYLRVLDG